MIWKNLEHLVSQTAFCGTQGQSYLKPINPGQVGSLRIYGIYNSICTTKLSNPRPAQFDAEIRVLLT
jgi:hypothetical protein